MYSSRFKFQPLNLSYGLIMFPRIYFGSFTLAMEKIRQEFPDKILVLDNNVEKIINNYSVFFDNKNIYIHTNISNENIKFISEKSKETKHILLFEDDSFDGRLSLVSKAKKNDLIFDCSYPLLGDDNKLRRLVNNFLFLHNSNIDSQAINFLINICPLYRIKSKQANSKKEIICYDIDLLFKELEKILSYRDKIFVSDLQDSVFNEEVDIFTFINNLLERNLEYCLEKINILINSMGEQGFLLVLLSQLQFLFVLYDCKEKNIIQPDKVQEIVECKDLLGKYLNEDYIVPEYTIKNQNPVRIKIELSKPNAMSSKQILTIIKNVVDTIVDLRTSGNASTSIPLLISKTRFV